MQCGAKCFVIKYEDKEAVKKVEIKARTQVLARKVFRSAFEDAKIISCVPIKK